MKRHRPWDKHHRSVAATASSSLSDDAATSTTPVPYVTINGHNYYSDRFYRNTTIYDDDVTLAATAPVNEGTNQNGTTTTTTNDMELLFDRSAFINSYFTTATTLTSNFSSTDDATNLNGNNANSVPLQPVSLTAVMFGTYTVDDTTLRHEFPNLFMDRHHHHDNAATSSGSARNGVPCLVIYGKRNGGGSSNDSDVTNNNMQNHGSERHRNNNNNSKTSTKNCSSLVDEKQEQEEKEKYDEYDDDTTIVRNVPIGDTDDDDDDDTTIISGPATQEEMTTIAVVSVPGRMITVSSDCDNVDHGTIATGSSSREGIGECPTTIHKNGNNSSGAFPNTVHFSQITSSWYNDRSSMNGSSLLLDDIIDPTTGYLNNNWLLQNRRTNIPFGVHHSKYIICFETDGSIVICITTANLTLPTTTDATWIQRFPPAQQQQSTLRKQHHPATVTKINRSDNTTKATTSCVPNDFGTAMAHYLQCTMLSTAPNNVTIHWFVQKYLHWKSIRQLERYYNFQSAQVQLVTVIPGDHPSVKQQRNSDADWNHKNKKSSAGTATSSYLFGQERISYLLQQLEISLSSSSKYKNVLYTKQDQIIVQPTSFGGGWTLANMAQLVRSYLGMVSTNQNHQTNDSNSNHNVIISRINDHDAIQRLDIVWPTNQFIKASIARLQFWETVSKVPSRNHDNDVDRIAIPNSEEIGSGGYLFYSSEAFNKNDLTCLNRMIMFEDSTEKILGRVPLIPHFKSVSRLIGQHHGIHAKYPKLPHCEDYFSWFLLTSACLSRGAQGEQVIRRNDDGTDTTVMSYTNFEMGVLFHSCLSENHQSDRIYCWNPTTNSPHTIDTKSPRLIHLPIPYRFRSSRYVDDEDIAMFCETPYFHEIPPGTGCEGNMQLTPYGSELAKRMH